MKRVLFFYFWFLSCNVAVGDKVLPIPGTRLQVSIPSDWSTVALPEYLAAAYSPDKESSICIRKDKTPQNPFEIATRIADIHDAYYRHTREHGWHIQSCDQGTAMINGVSVPFLRVTINLSSTQRASLISYEFFLEDGTYQVEVASSNRDAESKLQEIVESFQIKESSVTVLSRLVELSGNGISLEVPSAWVSEYRPECLYSAHNTRKTLESQIISFTLPSEEDLVTDVKDKINKNRSTEGGLLHFTEYGRSTLKATSSFYLKGYYGKDPTEGGVLFEAFVFRRDQQIYVLSIASAFPSELEVLRPIANSLKFIAVPAIGRLEDWIETICLILALFLLTVMIALALRERNLRDAP